MYDEGKSDTKVYRVDLATGARELWRQIRLPDPITDSFTPDGMLLTPDGTSYVCNYQRIISDLYLVDGLR